MRCHRSLLPFLLSALVFLGAFPAYASSAEDYFKGKTIRLTVGYGVGGGYDLFARMIAPYLSKTLNATVIVENMPGAGQIIALNRTMVNPPDGLQIMIVNGLGAALSQVIGDSGVRYDLSKMSHLGTISASPWVWVVGINSPIQSVQEAMKSDRELLWAASGPIDGVSDGAAFTCEALKLKCKIVFGYQGSNQFALATGRGEMDMIYLSDGSANAYVKQGLVKPIASMNRKRSRFFQSTPTIYEQIEVKPEAAQLLEFHSRVENLGRILVAPPGIPDDKLAFLREAVKTALSNPDLIAEGEKTERYVGYVDAEATRQAADKVVNGLTAEEKANVIRIIQTTDKK